jgi:hypothetical protein
MTYKTLKGARTMPVNRQRIHCLYGTNFFHRHFIHPSDFGMHAIPLEAHRDPWLILHLSIIQLKAIELNFNGDFETKLV